MAFPNIFHNISGTLKSAFRIGREGPSLQQGVDDPNVAQVTGIDGDLYIQHDVTEGIFQRRGGVWINIGGEGFRRTAVTAATYTVAATDYYVGVNYTGEGNSEIYLPPGVENKQYVIKDESGILQYQTKEIHVIPDGDETIDGDTDIIMIAPYMSLTLVFAAGEWRLL